MKWITVALILPLAVWGAQPNQIKTNVEFTGEPAVAIKTVIQTFGALGYRFDIDAVSAEDQQGSVAGTAVGLRPFDPKVFKENLENSGIRVVAAQMSRGVMELNIDSSKGIWNTQSLGSDEGVELKKTTSPQWFTVDEGQIIRIQPPYVGKWYPDIAVLDASMNVLYSLRSEKAKEELELKLPPGSRYLKVSNTQGMKVMNEGMWIESMSEGR